MEAAFTNVEKKEIYIQVLSYLCEKYKLKFVTPFSCSCAYFELLDEAGNCVYNRNPEGYNLLSNLSDLTFRLAQEYLM